MFKIDHQNLFEHITILLASMYITLSFTQIIVSAITMIPCYAITIHTGKLPLAITCCSLVLAQILESLKNENLKLNTGKKASFYISFSVSY